MYRKRILSYFIKKKTLAIFTAVLFFIVSLSTISHYNIMWDARNHFFRGQAFANFFLRGLKNYDELPLTSEYARYYRDYAKSFTPNLNIEKRLAKDPHFRRSIYQDEVHTFNWLMNEKATGHPTISDTLSSFFNILFYEKLGWLRDDHAYSLYSIVLASVLVGVIFYWMISQYGFFAAVIAILVLETTPLFWAESHYNIKDTPLLVFFSLSIWAFWNGIVSRSKRWIIFSAIFTAFALGTKFNTVFLPFILAPWFLFFLLTLTRNNAKKYLSWWWLIPIYPLIVFGIFVALWPQLWNDPIGSFLNVVAYYKSVGINVDYTPAFRTILGFSTYASFWILVTTYPAILFLGLIGVIGGIRDVWKRKDLFPLLLMIWLFVPIARASAPNVSIFGGVRHIIEYIPPLAMLSGYGASVIVKTIQQKYRQVSMITLIILFAPFILTLIKLHPAENTYFNSFIGGLPGAKAANLTGWGNTDGGIYKQAILWLNKNAEKNAHIAVGFSETADFYIPEFREDLQADNLYSGYLQKGEYIVALTHDSELENTYKMAYPEKFLDPVYQYKVDGVPLIKIWKNDKDHLKKEINEKAQVTKEFQHKRKGNELYWDLGRQEKIIAAEIKFEKSVSCANLSLGYFQISVDGENWKILPETYPGGPIEIIGEQPKNGKLIAPFAGYEVRYVAFVAEPENSCLLNSQKSKITVLE